VDKVAMKPFLAGGSARKGFFIESALGGRNNPRSVVSQSEATGTY